MRVETALKRLVRAPASRVKARAKAVALSHVPITGKLPRPSRLLDAAYFSSFSEFQAWKNVNAERIDKWFREDDATPAAFAVPGYCAICAEQVGFHADAAVTKINASGETVPNWREQLTCPGCHMCNRVRAALHLAIQDLGLVRDSRIYATEQFGIVYRWLRGHCQHVQGSEYLPHSRSWLLGIHHQDVQNLSLPDDSVDFIISFDVLEHVPDPAAAFRSFARVLAPGGRMVMTAPFTIDKYDTTIRAVMRDDGEIEHLLPIEVHGNPTDPENGALCFRHFGWDTLGQLSEAGFSDAKVAVYHNREMGYLGGMQSLVAAVK